MFTSVLYVSDVTPNRGSLNGGTELTIQGGGFSTNNTENVVMLGDVMCEVTESTENELKCKTPIGGKIVEIDNSGSHPGNTRQGGLIQKPLFLSRFGGGKIFRRSNTKYKT